MVQRDINWSQKRRDSSRTLAFYIESQGEEWTSIREAAHSVALQLGISTDGKRRSTIAIECHERLASNGLSVPDGYVAPWVRNGLPFAAPRRAKAIRNDRVLAFYDSYAWKHARFAILKSRGRRCECCGDDRKETLFHVDHIKPLRRYWHLRLDQNNLQVLCEPCNRGKGGRDETDFRT